MGVYGLLITSTGWTFAQADQACMSRVLELISFIRRGRDSSSQPSAHSRPPSEMTDADFSRDAMELQSITCPVFPSGGALPPHLREAVQWAEEQKAKVKMN